MNKLKYRIHSHRFGETILKNDAAFTEIWSEIHDIIQSISDDAIIKKFEEKYASKNKSLSKALNELFKSEFLKRGWASESPIFQDRDYSENVWRLDFAKDNISLEVGFNHSGTIAWNLLKPVIASELNHVEKAIQTRVGVIICATQRLQRAGNFDNAIGTFEKYVHHLKPLNTQLTVPIVIIGLEAPETFRIAEYLNENGEKRGRVEEFYTNQIVDDAIETYDEPLFDEDLD
ncbi:MULTISPECIES: BglII/BstYI family type II restriction endonuclease [unclassified Exiguobacterium]|uniref:BglII/BstYI family type II restriction endonuclease n=1 Tax=unclassified Exiguobacterium TaxID=2644629 RepID=UPI001EF10C4F|nr:MULTISPECIES: BglII/BstYI family type II restriction endonuclease [unclassified Exiguobacterium]